MRPSSQTNSSVRFDFSEAEYVQILQILPPLTTAAPLSIYRSRQERRCGSPRVDFPGTRSTWGVFLSEPPRMFVIGRGIYFGNPASLRLYRKLSACFAFPCAAFEQLNLQPKLLLQREPVHKPFVYVPLL